MLSSPKTQTGSFEAERQRCPDCFVTPSGGILSTASSRFLRPPTGAARGADHRRATERADEPIPEGAEVAEYCRRVLALAARAAIGSASRNRLRSS